MRIGVISDTHGQLRPEVFDAFQGVDHILHAGDIGGVDLLAELEALAPTSAVWGNTDDWDVRRRVPEIARVRLAQVEVVVLHGHQFGSPTPAAVAAAYPEAGLVVFGHSHVPVLECVGSVVALNPGSAGPRRFRLPVGVALVTIENGAVQARLDTLLR